MTESQQTDQPQGTRHTVVVPGSIDMVRLLGPGDDHLGLIERSFDLRAARARQPDHARGRARRGRPGRAAARRAGHADPLRPGDHRRDRRARAGDAARRDHRAPGRRAVAEHPEQPRPLDPAEDAQPEALRRLHRQAHDHLRHRPGRHRQDLPGDGQGRAGAPGQAGQPDHPDPPGRRGGRAARLPARHAQREDRPLPAAALRRPARHGRPRLDPEAAGRRHDRGGAAGVHARPLAQRLVHHPRRGAEHLAGADEDVPDPARVRLQDRGHRRRHPGRPARRREVRAAGRRGHPRRGRGRLLPAADRPRRRAAQAGRADRRGVRRVRRPAAARRRSPRSAGDDAR